MKRLVRDVYESLGGDGLIAVAFWFAVLLVLAALAEGGNVNQFGLLNFSF